MSFASNKTKILELVGTSGHMKPSNFGHTISHRQEVYPVSLKQNRLVKMIVFEERNCILQSCIVNFPGKVRKYFEIIFGQISGVFMEDLWNRNNIPRKFHISLQRHNSEGGATTGCTTEQNMDPAFGIILTFSLAARTSHKRDFYSFFLMKKMSLILLPCMWQFSTSL